MNILLTNDDGFNSEGINVLKSLLEKHGTVVIIAPDKHRSGASSSLTITDPIKVEKVEDKVFKCNGTPVDCVSFGLSSLNVKFDLVVSGCNHGLNISYDTMYSGTIGATLQALTYRIPAIAISCENNFDIVRNHLNQVMKYIIDNELLSTEYSLNINFPLGEKVEDIRLTHIYYRKETTYYIESSKDHYYATRDINDSKCDELDSDVYSVYHSIVSITKIKRTLD